MPLSIQMTALTKVFIVPADTAFWGGLGINMSEKIVKFEFEKHNKNSVRYKEIPEDGMPPVIGSIYVQKWFAGNSKNIEITISKKDWLNPARYSMYLPSNLL